MTGKSGSVVRTERMNSLLKNYLNTNLLLLRENYAEYVIRCSVDITNGTLLLD